MGGGSIPLEQKVDPLESAKMGLGSVLDNLQLNNS